MANSNIEEILHKIDLRAATTSVRQQYEYLISLSYQHNHPALAQLAREFYSQHPELSRRYL